MANNPQVILKNRYQVVPRSLILVFDEKKVLLQKAADTKKIWSGKYNGLGGHVEKGEDILTSAKRELLEEAGITCENLHMAGSVMIDVAEEHGILMFVFTGNSPQGTLIPSEEGSLEWVEINKVSTLPVVEDIPLLLELITKQKQGDLFYGHYSYNNAGKLIANFILQK